MKKMKNKIRVQEEDGLYEVELVEVGRERITSERELRDGIATILSSKTGNTYSGRGFVAESPADTYSRQIVNYLKNEPKILQEFVDSTKTRRE